MVGSSARWIAHLAMTSMVVGLANVALAQQDFSKVEIKTTDLGDGLAMLQGAGGNVGLSVGPDGIFLIDDQYAPMSDKIRAAIERFLETPGLAPSASSPNANVRFVLNTHWHGDHTGGNESFGDSGALILAHRHVRDRMSTRQFIAVGGGREVPASPAVAWPVVTFDQGLSLHLNGQTIEATHVAAAHTDGDTIVYFREADLLHTGDTYFNGVYPFIDTSSGGGINGMIAAVDRALAIAGEATRIIPGHGALSNRRELEATRNMLVSIRDRVLKLIAAGRDREQVVASKPTREFDAVYGGGFMKPDFFAAIVYDSLATKK